MFDFNEIFSLDYWFSPIATVFYWWRPIAYFFLALIIISVVIMVISKKKLFFDKPVRRFLRGLESGLIMFGVTGLVWTFIRHEGVRYLSMRFFFLLILVFFIFWAAYHIFKFKVLVPRVESHFVEQKNIDKYRPAIKSKGKKKRKR